MSERFEKIKKNTEGINVFALETGDLQFLIETVESLKKERDDLKNCGVIYCSNCDAKSKLLNQLRAELDKIKTTWQQEELDLANREATILRDELAPQSVINELRADLKLAVEALKKSNQKFQILIDYIDEYSRNHKAKYEQDFPGIPSNSIPGREIFCTIQNEIELLKNQIFQREALAKLQNSGGSEG